MYRHRWKLYSVLNGERALTILIGICRGQKDTTIPVRSGLRLRTVVAVAILSCLFLWSAPSHAQNGPARRLPPPGDNGPQAPPEQENTPTPQPSSDTTQSTPISSSSPPPCDPTVIIGGPCKTVGQTEMDCKGQNILACLYPPGQSTGQIWYIAGTDAIPDCMGSHQILQFDGTRFSCIAPFPTCPAGQVFYFDGTTLKCGTGAPPPTPPTCGPGLVLSGYAADWSCVTPTPTPTPCDCSVDPMCNSSQNTVYNDCPAGQEGTIITTQTLDCFGNVVATSPPNNLCRYEFPAVITQTRTAGQMISSCDASGQNCQQITCPVSSP